MEKNLDSHLTNLASRELIALWQTGSQDAARVLFARYEARLVALIAARLNEKYRSRIAADDVVQSALGSFFRATSPGAKPSIQLESTASAWNILATFARRKLARFLERETATKRGGGLARVSLDNQDSLLCRSPWSSEVDQHLSDLYSMLDSQQSQLLELLLENATQKEIAERLRIDQRTVRRRLNALRNTLAGQFAPVDHESEPALQTLDQNIDLKCIPYRSFVLGKLVGRGALGKVYRARMQIDSQIVAVKFMHRHMWNNKGTKLSFLREIASASRIAHPGVVQYFGWGESPHGGPYLVSEFVAGRSLANIRSDDLELSVQWLTQICQAVSASHRAGVIHGDLTPNNVLLDNQGRIVLTDFGFANYSASPSIDDTDTQRSRSFGGTLGFAAPEQISPAFGSISFATDIYAIGGIACYLLTGRSPHDDRFFLDTISENEVVLSGSLGTNAESKLVTVANLALRKDVASRPQSVADLNAVLQE